MKLSPGFYHGYCVQMREREARAEEMQRDAAKPFARTADDMDIDRAYRERVRFGDPMAHLAAKRQRDAPPPPVVPEHMRKLMRKSGFVVPQVRTQALLKLTLLTGIPGQVIVPSFAKLEVQCDPG